MEDFLVVRVSPVSRLGYCGFETRPLRSKQTGAWDLKGNGPSVAVWHRKPPMGRFYFRGLLGAGKRSAAIRCAW